MRYYELRSGDAVEGSLRARDCQSICRERTSHKRVASSCKDRAQSPSSVCASQESAGSRWLTKHAARFYEASHRWVVIGPELHQKGTPKGFGDRQPEFQRA